MKTLPISLPRFTIIAALAALSITAAHAQTLITANLANPNSTIINTTSGEPRIYENYGDLGFIFQVGSSDLLVNSLGMYAPSAGLGAANTIRLYQLTGDNLGSGILLATASVAAGAEPDAQGFTYATLPSVATLVSGDYYAIDYVDSSVDPFYDSNYSSSSTALQLSTLFDTSAINPMQVTLNGNSMSLDPDFPTQAAYFGYYIGPNAKFTVLPEPSSASLLLAGILIALALVRRRKRA